MIQPIAYNSVNFSGHLVTKAAENRKEKSVDEVLAHIPGEEEREIFKEGLDTFQKRVEERTSEASNFVLELGHNDWYAGKTHPYGKGITFKITDTQDPEEPVFIGTHPITRPNGNLWDKGEKFKSELIKYLNDVANIVISSRNLKEARQRADERNMGRYV